MAHEEYGGAKWIASVAYMLSMGCCGIVLVTISSTFENLAQQVQKSTTELGTVFILRGLGSIVGTISCSKLFAWFPENYVLSCSLGLITFMLILIPFSYHSIQLHIFFFFLGMGTAVTDTGCQLMTRKVHRNHAGPWLGINATIFGLSAAVVPIIEMFARDMISRYIIFASIVGFTTCFMLVIANFLENNTLENVQFKFNTIEITYEPIKGNNLNNQNILINSNNINSTIDEESTRIIQNNSQNNSHKNSDNKQKIPHYYTEILVALMLFCFVGGGVTAAAYLETYIDQTKIIDNKYKEKIFFVFWFSLTIGRFAGCFVQQFLGDSGVIMSISLFSVGGFLSMILIFLFPYSTNALWIGVIFYGFFHGPTVGYCQDLNNRLTYLNENSMAIVMFGLVCGASFVPFFTALIWKYYNYPLAFIIILGFSMILPLPLLHLTYHVSYINTLKLTNSNNGNLEIGIEDSNNNINSEYDDNYNNVSGSNNNSGTNNIRNNYRSLDIVDRNLLT